MRGGQGDAQPRLAARDGRIADGRNKNVLFAQFRGGVNGFGFVAEDERDDGAWNCGLRIADCGLKFVDALPELFPPRFAFGGLNKLNCRGGGGGGGGNGRGAENKTAGAVDQKINQRARAANVAAARAERLAERAHLDFDLAADAEFVRQAAAVFADKAGRVRLVHHQPRAVFFLERDDFAQRRGVAVHARKCIR